MSVTTPAEELRSTDLALVVGGTEYRGWQAIDVTRSLDDVASSWSVTGTLRWPGESSAYRFRPDAAVELRIGSDLVLTGYVDTIRYDTGAALVTVAGRSRTGDLVDCSAAPGQYRGLSLYELATELARPYGVSVVIDATALEAGRGGTTWIRRGTTVFQAVEEQARRHGLLCTDDERGRLCLIRAGGARSTTALVVGENVLGGDVSADASRRYSVYRVRSQTAGDDQSYGPAVTQIDGEETDGGLARYRLLVLDAPGLSRDQAQSRARWEAATRAGQSLTVAWSVRGWRQGDGRLWRTDELVRCVDRESGIDADLLVRQVSYRVDAEGQVTTLTLCPRIGYLLETPPGSVGGRGHVGPWRELEGGV